MAAAASSGVVSTTPLPGVFRVEPRIEPAAGVPAAPAAVSTDQWPTLADVERLHLERTLAAAVNNKSLAAKLLGIDRSVLRRKLQQRARHIPAARAHQEQVLDVLCLVVGAEPGALQQNGLKPEGRTLVGREAVFEINRRDELLRDDVIAQARQHGGLEMRGDGVAVGGRAPCPVDAGSLVWHGREHVEGLATRRRQRRVHRRGGGEEGGQEEEVRRAARGV